MAYLVTLPSFLSPPLSLHFFYPHARCEPIIRSGQWMREAKSSGGKRWRRVVTWRRGGCSDRARELLSLVRSGASSLLLTFFGLHMRLCACPYSIVPACTRLCSIAPAGTRLCSIRACQPFAMLPSRRSCSLPLVRDPQPSFSLAGSSFVLPTPRLCYWIKDS